MHLGHNLAGFGKETHPFSKPHCREGPAMHAGGVDPPGNLPHATGFDPPAGQQKLELFDCLRETFRSPKVSPPRRTSSSALTLRALVPERETYRTFAGSVATHLLKAAATFAPSRSSWATSMPRRP
jgi:hypothetical protein